MFIYINKVMSTVFQKKKYDTIVTRQYYRKYTISGGFMNPKLLIIDSRGAIAEKLSQEAERRGFFVHIAHYGEGGKQCFLKKRTLNEEFDVISISTPLSLRPFEIQNEKVSSFVIDYFARKNFQGTILHCVDENAHKYQGSFVEFPFSLNETIVQPYGLFDAELIKKWGSLCEESLKEKVSMPASLV